MNDWTKTDVACRRLSDHPKFEIRIENGQKVPYFRGRRLIGRDTPINGGVYVGAGSREAIVVDDLTQTKLGQAYDEFVLSRKGLNFKDHILTALFNFVREKMPPDDSILSDLLLEDYQLGGDHEVPLEKFMETGGVCRHLPLLAGYILERLVIEGKLNGKVSIDRNYMPGLGGHAWVRYVTAHNRVVVIDPVISGFGFIGYMDEFKFKPEVPWNYCRPGE